MTFDPLTKALEGWFDKPMAELPGPLRSRVEFDFSPLHWDRMDADQRRTVAKQMDYQNDPATEEERSHFFDLFCEKDSIEQDIRKLETMSVPTPLDRESKMRQLKELQEELKSIKAQIDAPAATDSPRRSAPVSSHKIITAFVVKNEKWWNLRMRDAKDYGLLNCRASPGRGNRPSLWHPDLVAMWLLDKGHMPFNRVDSAVRKHFPECAEDIARLSPV